MKNLILTLYHLVNILGLYLANLIMVRKLGVKLAAVRFESLHNRSRAVVSWEAQGCYKIKIKFGGATVQVPGNSTAVSIRLGEEPISAIIVFQGVFNRIEHRVPLYGANLQFVHPFFAIPCPFNTGLDSSSLVFATAFNIGAHIPDMHSYFSNVQLGNSFREHKLIIHIPPNQIKAEHYSD